MFKKRVIRSTKRPCVPCAMELDPLPNGNSSMAGGTLGLPVSEAAGGGSSSPSLNQCQLTESLKLEHQFLRVPFEHYKKAIRSNQRLLDREVSAVISGVVEASDADLSPADAVDHLHLLVSRIQGLKRKLEEGNNAENFHAQRCRARLDYLQSSGVNKEEWNDMRLKRILVDYMLRMSYHQTAVMLAESNKMQNFVDIEAFNEAKSIIDALNNKEAGAALNWCSDNKFRLRKSKSKLEFQIRLQEFIELVRVKKKMKAIAYARKHLAPWGAAHMKELQRVMATLAFKSTTECATYKVLFEGRQWDVLVEQFKLEFCKLYGMTLDPLFSIYLQAGLSSLKTPFCYEEGCTKDDPLSQESFRKLAEPLPFSKQHHSKLVCYISNKLMDTDNPPIVLPNGYVYSTKAMEEMARKNNGKITCPRTGHTCNYSEVMKVYIS